MRSIILVIALSLALAAQAFNFTVKDRPSTPPKSRPSSSSAVITDKQINNARFSRRTSSVNNEADKLVNHEARHTMIVDSPIRDSDFHIRSLPEQNVSKTLADQKPRSVDRMVTDNHVFVHVHKPNGESENYVERKSRDTFIDKSQINDGVFSRRGLNESDEAKMPVERKSRNTFINKSQINDGVFSRRSDNGLGEEKMPLERKSRDTHIGRSQINDGVFTRRSTDRMGEEKMPVERKSRDTWIDRSQINNGRFSRRFVQNPSDERRPSVLLE